LPLRGYVGKLATCNHHREAVAAFCAKAAATASRLTTEEVVLNPNVAAKRGNVGLKAATASRLMVEAQLTNN